jgi:hypothetical protein
MLYSFFVICDTKDPSIFHIEMTCMKDYRLRFSAMKSNHNRKFGFNVPMKIHTLDTNCNCDLTGFHKILKGNSTYYLLEKRDFESAEEASKFKAELIKFRSVKHPHSTQKCDSILVRFTQ